MKINNNISAINSRINFFLASNSLDRSLERLSSGMRINSSQDDAAGLSISEKMRTQIKGLSVSSANAQDARRLLRITDAALSKVHDLLGRLEELATQAASDINTSQDRTHLQAEVTQILNQIDQIATNTQYNTKRLLDGSLKITAGCVSNLAIKWDSMQDDIPFKQASIRIGRPWDPSNTRDRASVAGMVSWVFTTINGRTITPSEAGVLNINGVDVRLNAGMNVNGIVNAINAVSDQTKVLASASAGGITLISGYRQGATNYALLGSNYKIEMNSTNPNLLAAFNFRAYDWTPTDPNNNGWVGWVARNVAYGRDIWAANTVFRTHDNVGYKGSNQSFTIEGNKIIAGNDSDACGLEIETDIGATVNFGWMDIIGHPDRNPDMLIGHTTTLMTYHNIFFHTQNQMKIQVGANANENVKMSIQGMTTRELGKNASGAIASSLADINILTHTGANDALKVIAQAVQDVSKQRARIGAKINRMDFVSANLNSQHENMQAAESRIRDTDMAKEMTALTRQSILLMASTAMLAQANSRAEKVLNLLKI